jgi:hypothetical protein
MGFLNLNSSIRYSTTGKRRKTKAFSKPPKRIESKIKRQVSPELYKRQEEQYKSLMEEYMKSGEYHKIAGDCSKKESPKYTGTLVKGIATMHKSNAVPVINQKEAEDIARMRR